MVLDFLSILQDPALLVARVFVGVLFLIHGRPKIAGPMRKQMRDSSGQLGIPRTLFDLIALLENFGGLALIVGLLTRFVAVLFALEMVGTTILVVTKLYKLPIPRGYIEADFKRTRGYLGGWELDTVLLAAALLLAAFGPGNFSIDAILPLRP